MFGLLEAVYVFFIVGATIAAVGLRDAGHARFWGAAAVIALSECVVVAKVGHESRGVAMALGIPFVSIPILVSFWIARLGRKRSPVAIGFLAGIGNLTALVLESVLFISSGLVR